LGQEYEILAEKQPKKKKKAKNKKGLGVWLKPKAQKLQYHKKKGGVEGSVEN
jgi:hypothetical protein